MWMRQRMGHYEQGCGGFGFEGDGGVEGEHGWGY